MQHKKWLFNNTQSLKNKTVAITGSTGSIGQNTCFYLAALGANLILVDRNINKSLELKEKLEKSFLNINVRCITADLQDINSVKVATKALLNEEIDVFIHNAGAYSIPRKISNSGYDNVFTINFVSPYYMIKALLPNLRKRKGRVIAVGSIAHNYSKTDKNDIDFRNKKAASRVYGNAKRYLQFSLLKLFENEKDAFLSIVHPGITFTNITAHYPPIIFAVIKYPMKIIFMPPKKASLCLVFGVFTPCRGFEWIGPRLFNIWGYPKKKCLTTCSVNEAEIIFNTAEEIFNGLEMSE